MEQIGKKYCAIFALGWTILLTALLFVNLQAAYGQTCVGDICVQNPLDPPASPPPEPSVPSNSSSSPSSSGGSSGSSSGGSSAPSVVPTPITLFLHYPRIALDPLSQNPTNKTSLTLRGKATVEAGSIARVEYSIDGGAWSKATARDGLFNSRQEAFFFDLKKLLEAKYIVKVRGLSSSGMVTPEDAQATETVVIITTAPSVALDPFPARSTRNTKPTVAGSASSKLGEIARVEASFDNGRTWRPGEHEGGKFKVTADTLGGGRHQVVARAYDNAGNVGKSKPQELVVDTSLQTLAGVLLIGAVLVGVGWNVFFYKKTKVEEKRKSEYISAAAHELRTPITAIKWYLDEILKGGFGPIKPDLKTPLQGTATVTENLIDMVNNMLNVSRLEEGRLATNVSVFPIWETADGIVSILEPLGRASNIAISHSVPHDLYAKADKEHSREIIINLVGNALKFTNAGSIKVSTSSIGNQVKVRVTDTGRGIKDDDKEKLFKKYGQVGEQGKITGTGLGLFISREMARKMGGDVWLEKSEPGKGSTFAFSIPKASKPDKLHNSEKAKTAPVKNPNPPPPKSSVTPSSGA